MSMTYDCFPEILIRCAASGFCGTGTFGQFIAREMLSPLSGVKRTCADALQMSAFDPNRTYTTPQNSIDGISVPLQNKCAQKNGGAFLSKI
jgi:hypothetical protein